ncbi:MAG: glucosaminidase domain-containing protein [Butyricicoccus sp.]
MAVQQIYIEYAKLVQSTYNVPASVCLGQFVYESAAGTSHLAQVANNCFGIKGTGPAGSYRSASGSVWRKYNNKKESFLDWGKLVTNSNYSRYTKNSKDPYTFLTGLVKGGYCPDAGYVSAVMSIIKSNGFTKYDSSSGSSNSSNSVSSSAAKDIVDVAISQIGYAETGNNYTKYGAWCGQNGAPWCHMFVSWCANQAGIPTSVVPKTASTTEGMNWFKNKGQFKYKGSYTPKRGDIIYFKTGASHVGIVEYVSGSTVHTIEGNASDRVKRCSYSLSYSTITGYGVPNYSYVKGDSEGVTVDGSNQTSAEEIAYLKKILAKKKTTVDLSVDAKVKKTNRRPYGVVTVTVANSKKVFTIPVKDGMKITWERSGTPGKLVFEARRESGYKINEGNSVLVTVDGYKFFYGFIFTHQHSKDGWVQYTAYDQLRYLKNKDTLVYRNKRADQLVRTIANRFNLNCGKLANTGYARSAVEADTTLMDMIQNALDDTLLTKNKMYVLFDKVGELRLKNVANMKVNTCLIDAETGEDYTYKASIDSDVYNQIKLVYENDQTGSYDYYIAKSSALINRWGVLQYEETIDDPDVGKLKSQAYLKLYGQKQVTLKITGVIGNRYVRGGSLVPVTLELPDKDISNYMIVDKVVHTFQNRYWTMDLNVSGGGFTSE